MMVTTLYGAGWGPVEGDGSTPPAGHLSFGNLKKYYDDAADLLPSVARADILDPATLWFERWAQGERLVWARVWLFRMPSGRSVAAVSLGVDVDLEDTVELLNDLRHLLVKVAGRPLEEHLSRLGDVAGASDAMELGVSRECYQIVVGPSLPPGLDEQERHSRVERVIYRTHRTFRPAAAATFAYPPELNRRPGSTVAIGPYVSVMLGNEDEEDNAALVSAAQVLGSASRLRHISEQASWDLQAFRDAQKDQADGVTSYDVLGRVANRLGDLELELTFAVESVADLSLLVPSVRLTSYHAAIFAQMGLHEKAATVSRMLERLGRSIRAERTALEAQDRRADDERRKRWEGAYIYLATIPLAMTLGLAYLGMNASEVDSTWSMWDGRHLPIYGAILAVVLGGIAIPGLITLRQRREAARRAALDLATERRLTMARRRSA